jgi:hypothetical protein
MKINTSSLLWRPFKPNARIKLHKQWQKHSSHEVVMMGLHKTECQMRTMFRKRALVRTSTIERSEHELMLNYSKEKKWNGRTRTKEFMRHLPNIICERIKFSFFLFLIIGEENSMLPFIPELGCHQQE